MASKKAQFNLLCSGLVKNGDEQMASEDFDEAENSYLHAYFVGKAIPVSKKGLMAIRKRLFQAFAAKL